MQCGENHDSGSCASVAYRLCTWKLLKLDQKTLDFSSKRVETLHVDVLLIVYSVHDDCCAIIQHNYVIYEYQIYLLRMVYVTVLSLHFSCCTKTTKEDDDPLTYVWHHTVPQAMHSTTTLCSTLPQFACIKRLQHDASHVTQHEKRASSHFYCVL